MDRVIWVGGKRYYYYDSYNSFPEMMRAALYHKSKGKRYFYIKYETKLFPSLRFALYLDRMVRVSLW